MGDSPSSSSCPINPCSLDSSDGVLGPHGCGGRGSPLVGHPSGCAGRAAGTGAAGATAVEGEAWGAVGPLVVGIMTKWAASCAMVL